MSHTFRGDILEIRASGRYAPAEIDDEIRAALAEPTRPTIRALLYDARESEVVQGRSTADVTGAVGYFQSLGDEIGQRVAMLVSSDVAYGVMRMVEGWAAARGIDAAVFRNAEEAFAWASR